MSGTSASCVGCAQSQRRFRSTTPRLWCQRFHQPATARCACYRTRTQGIRAAMTYIKALAIK